MPEETKDPLPELIKKFQSLKTHADKCEFLHAPENYKHLGKVFSAVHYPKPADKPPTE